MDKQKELLGLYGFPVLSALMTVINFIYGHEDTGIHAVVTLLLLIGAMAIHLIYGRK